MKIKNDFSSILESYFSKHLKLERKFSINTYDTYLTVLKQFINYLSDELKIKRHELSLYDFNKKNIMTFLDYVERSLKCSSKTRNHKLTIINSFLEYAQSINPVYIDLYLSSKSIKMKKVPKKKMDFMTVEEMKAFFKCIDLRYRSGYKHYIMLTVLYETGARVSELINMEVSDIFFNKDPYIKIAGKGNRERLVYINDSVVSMIKEYMKKFKIKSGFLFLNHSNEKFTRYGVNKIVNKYYEKAKKMSNVK